MSADQVAEAGELVLGTMPDPAIGEWGDRHGRDGRGQAWGSDYDLLAGKVPRPAQLKFEAWLDLRAGGRWIRGGS